MVKSIAKYIVLCSYIASHLFCILTVKMEHLSYIATKCDCDKHKTKPLKRLPGL